MTELDFLGTLVAVGVGGFGLGLGIMCGIFVIKVIRRIIGQEMDKLDNGDKND